MRRSTKFDYDMGNNNWTLVIRSKAKWFDINLSQLWNYRDLILLFVKRDFTAIYKQTILGPLWHFIQPLFSSLVFAFAFSYIGKISTGNIPPVLFYLSGIVPWAYFSDCTNRTSNTFISNSGMFGKVYFPRLITPISVIISSLIKFFIQSSMLIVFILYFVINGNPHVNPNAYLLIFPVLVVIMALLGIGIGTLVSSLTTRYRDLSNLVGFGIQLLFYLSPVLFPASIWPEKIRWIIYVNPMTSVIEDFRLGFLGVGSFDGIHLLYSLLFSVAIFLLGITIFTKVEKTFIDTI